MAASHQAPAPPVAVPPAAAHENDGKYLDRDGWIYRCEQFFEYEGTSDEKKVRIVAINLEGRALQWHRAMMKGRVGMGLPNWNDYLRGLYHRFGHAIHEDPMAELISLKQTGNVHDFLDSFDGLLNQVELSEAYSISCFLKELKPEIEVQVRMLSPRTLTKAYILAKLAEHSLNLQRNQRNFRPLLPTPTSSGNSNPRGNLQIQGVGSSRSVEGNKFLGSNGKSVVRGSKKLSTTKMDERRALGLCFWYDEKFVPGHNCRGKKQMYLLEIGEEEEDWDIAENFSEKENKEESALSPQRSVHALDGIVDYRTMRVKGGVKGKMVHVLIDTWSTHNFMDLDVAKRLGCNLETIPPFSVAVANGSKIHSRYMSKGITWKMQGVKFRSDMGYKMELHAVEDGVPDCGKKVSLRSSQLGAPKLLDNHKMQRLLHKSGELSMMITTYVQPIKGELATLNSQQVQGSDDVQKLLSKHTGLFEAPRALLPHRSHDHRIILKEGTSSINVRPYRYVANQKDEIERMIKEMLDSGVIKPSVSPYSSPIVMVKNKDGTWRLCIDYRQLNNCTVKDKFPIPVIEELLDELGGAKFFSILDLRSGYHQIRMADQDIEKTAFRSHNGYYEFVVMSFGLTNVPSTFQILMNHIFQPLLRKFILVFFDDILIYSSSWSSHLVHLEQAFKILEDNNLFVKISKCTFGQT
ncbi:uncharacterized protein LOC107793610 [Nicotiana tabacum]|uniref:Uncharacterized protein LOC107793610 n=1 Tax=Nicotiana tabacum TaxID=4097 RepID=A0A1S4A4B8_TOBAC